MAPMLQRVLAAARLNPQIYEEGEAAQSAFGQSIGVAILSSVAAGIGYFPQGGLGGLVAVTLVALLGWYIWAELTYIIGAKCFPAPQTHTSHRELLGTFGFASAPGIVRILGVIPRLTGLTFLVAALWMLGATVIAVRQACDYRTTIRAFMVCIVGWVVQMLLLLLILLIFG